MRPEAVTTVSTRALLALVCGLLAAAAVGQAQMPDARQMSGIPRPVDDLPPGAVSVRLIRGDLSNNIVNHPVELHVGGRVQTVNTDEGGRAQFEGMTPGTPLKAVAVVDGERLESQEFPAPDREGIRLLLVATDPNKTAGDEVTAPAVAGRVTIGGDSRIVIEPDEDTVRIYYLLDIVNMAETAVTPEAPFAFDTPRGALTTSVMQGSSPLARATGTRVNVQGPFPPGITFVQTAYALPSSSGTVELAQAFPVALENLVVVVKKVGDAKLSSPLITRQQEMPVGEDIYIAGAGEGLLPAGEPVILSVTGLPHHGTAARWIALSLAATVVLIGILAARGHRGPEARAAERKRLIARREKLFQDLLRLELDQRRGRVEPSRYAARREELLMALEHVYGALESDDTSPEPANRTGLAA